MYLNMIDIIIFHFQYSVWLGLTIEIATTTKIQLPPAPYKNKTKH